MSSKSFNIYNKKFKRITITKDKIIFFQTVSEILESNEDPIIFLDFPEIDKITCKEGCLYIRTKKEKAQGNLFTSKIELSDKNKADELIFILTQNSYLNVLERKESATFAVINHYSFFIFLYLLFTTFLFTIGSLHTLYKNKALSSNILAVKFYNSVSEFIPETIFYSMILTFLLGIILLMRKVYTSPKNLYLFKCC